MFNQLSLAIVITRREVRDQFRDWRIIFPVIGLTLFFPFLMNFTASTMLNFVERYGANIIGERLVPFLLMIVGFFPISVSLVMALETFVGEKERGSIEPLLDTPLEDWQLYLGKLLAATIPPLMASYLGMSVYLAGLLTRHIPLPEPMLLLQIFALTTVQAVVMVTGAVVVSSQATSVRAANLLASFIIIPVAILIQGESVLMFWGDYSSLWWAVFGLLVLSLLLVRVGTAHFQREELLGREIDVLNMRWMLAVVKQSVIGNARSPWDWYIHSIPQAVKAMGTAVYVTVGLAFIGMVIGATLMSRFQIPIQSNSLNDVNPQLQQLLKLWPVGSFAPVLSIFWQNLRVLLISMILGTFSLGVLGVVPLMVSTGVTGYLYELLTSHGLLPATYIGLLVPHGIFEIPAAILATAAVLHAGALLATPNSQKTIGETFLIGLSNWLKIMLGLVLPLLFIAAVIEAWVTPRLAQLFFH